jgi:hypothetical protein
MLADLDETIRQLLVDELPVKNGEIEISFEQPTRDWSSRISRPTVNLFLYDVRENNVLRRHNWERLNHAGEKELAQLKRTPMRVDCAYILTTWAADPADEHRLLTRSMLTLFRFPTLPDHRLVGSLQHPPYEIQAKLAQHDRLENPTDLWNVLDNEIRPGVSYVVTLALDPWSEVPTEIVRTRIFRLGQAQGLPAAPGLRADADRADLIVVGGVIRDKADGAPVPGIEVALRGTGYVTTTDSEGRYVLGSVTPGDYTLVAWPAEGPPQQAEIAIPSEIGAYDMEV